MSLALEEEEKEVHTQILEGDDDFGLNEDAKDVNHDGLYHTYFLDLEREKLVLDLLPHIQIHKFQTRVGHEKRNLPIRETLIERAFDKGKEINVLFLLKGNQSDFECTQHPNIKALMRIIYF